MGRYYYSSKQEADGLKKVDIYWLKKYHYLDGYRNGVIQWTAGYSGNKTSIGVQSDINDHQSYVRLFYTQTYNETSEVKEFDYKIPLLTTPCNFGGKRYWFKCPLLKDGIYCGKRVGVLYKDGDYFACRHCYNLSYSSKNINKRLINTYPYSVLIMDEKITKLEAKIKRKYYNGKPTRKQRRVNKLCKSLNFKLPHELLGKY